MYQIIALTPEHNAIDEGASCGIVVEARVGQTVYSATL